MTVLPYVTVSLITGLGTLGSTRRALLGLRVGAVLVLLWAVALAAVFLFPLMFPPLETASFFSTTLLEEREPFDLVNLYIPSNPFNSLANNVVPAVVLFSVVARHRADQRPGKEALCSTRSASSTRPSAKATRFIVSLTPYGMFAIARRGGRHAGGRGRRAAAGVPGQLRRDLAAAQPVGAARAGGRADARAVSRAARRHARRAGHRVHDEQPVRRAADADRADASASCASTRASARQTRRCPTSSSRPRSTSRTPASCCR